MANPQRLAPAVLLDTFKHWARHIAPPAVDALIAARAFAETERTRVDAYIAPIFAAYEFEYGALGERCGLTGKVPSPRELYLVDDGMELRGYYSSCDVAHRDHGFTGPKGYCPALMAENRVIEAENALIRPAQPLFGIEHVYGADRTQYLELLAGAALLAKKEARRG